MIDKILVAFLAVALPLCQSVTKNYGIQTSVCLIQTANESAKLTSPLGRIANNPGGLTIYTGCGGTNDLTIGEVLNPIGIFCNFSSKEAGFDFYGWFVATHFKVGATPSDTIWNIARGHYADKNVIGYGKALVAGAKQSYRYDLHK